MLNQFYMAAIVDIISRCGLIMKCVIETILIRVSCCCISRFFKFNNHLKQLYISNKTERFGYKYGYGMTLTKMFKRRAGLDYRLMALDYYNH